MNPNRTLDHGATPAFSLTVAESLEMLGVPEGRGLSTEDVSRLRATFGFNELQEAPPTPLWRKFLGQAKLMMMREGIKRGIAPAGDQLANPNKRLPPYFWAAFVLSGDWR